MEIVATKGTYVLLGQNRRIGSVSGDGLLQVRVDGGLEPVRDAFEVAPAKIEYAGKLPASSFFFFFRRSFLIPMLK